MKYIKYLIIFFVIIIIIISTLLFYSLNAKKEKPFASNNIQELNNTANTIQDLQGPENNEYNIDRKDYNQLDYEKNRSNYFTINNLYNNYINVIGSKEKEKLKNILSEDYKIQYNITDNNIFDKLVVPSLTDSSQYYKPMITEMLTTQIDDTTYVYIVKGKCRIVNMNNTILNINAMFELNMSNNTYSVYPYNYMKDKGYDRLNAGNSINYTPEKIEKNANNEFKYAAKTDLEMAKEYFNNYKELLLFYKDEAYSKLDEQYSKKRFGSKENFETYLKENNLTIALMNTDKYKVKSYQNYTDYICSDKYDNIYIFRQQGGIMRYSAFLDNYTIMPDEDKEYYNKLDKFDKAKYNLTKFIRMVNTKDYNAIYNVLDTTFRTNNFSTADKFKSYLKSNMYDCNTIEIKDYDDKTYEYYVFSCKIINMKNTNESKNMTIIINQTEGTEFTMSFSFE